MGGNLGTLATAVVEIKGDQSKFIRDLTRTKSLMNGFDQQAMAMTRNIGMAFVGMGVAVGAGLTAAVVVFGEFEQTMTNVAAVSNATADEFDRLSDFAKKMGETTVFSARQAGEAMYFLASAGLAVEEQMEATNAIMDLAAATQSGLAEASELTITSIKAFGLATSESHRVVNIFAAAISSSQATMSKLSIALPFISTQFNQLDFSIETTTAALSLLIDRGLRASMAATRLRGAMQKLLRVTPQLTKGLAKLGLTIEDVNPVTHDLVDIVRTFEEAGLDAASAAEIFGARSEGMTVLVDAGADALEKMTDKITGTSRASEMAARQLDTLNGDFKLLKSAVEGVAIKIGEALAPAMRGTLQAVTKLVGIFNALPDVVVELTTKFAALGAAVAIAGGTMLVITSQLPRLVTVLVAVRGAVKALAFEWRLMSTQMRAGVGIIASMAAVTVSMWAYRRIVNALEQPLDAVAIKTKANAETTKEFKEHIKDITVAFEDWKRRGLDPATAVLGQLDIDIDKLNKRLNTNFTIWSNVENVLAAFGHQAGIVDSIIKDTTNSLNLFAELFKLIDKGLVALGMSLDAWLIGWDEAIGKFNEWTSITGKGWQSSTDEAIAYFKGLKKEGNLSVEALLAVNRKIVELEKKKTVAFNELALNIAASTKKAAEKEVAIQKKKVADFAKFRKSIFDAAIQLSNQEDRIRKNAIEQVRVAGLTERQIVIEKYGKLAVDSLASGELLAEIERQKQAELTVINEREKKESAELFIARFNAAIEATNKEIELVEKRREATEKADKAILDATIKLSKKQSRIRADAVEKIRLLGLTERELIIDKYDKLEALAAEHGIETVRLKQLEQDELDAITAKSVIIAEKILDPFQSAFENLFVNLFDKKDVWKRFWGDMGRILINEFASFTTKGLFDLAKKGIGRLFRGKDELATDLSQSEDATLSLSSGMDILSFSADGVTTSMQLAALAIQEYTAAVEEAGLLDVLTELAVGAGAGGLPSMAGGGIARYPTVAVIGDNPGGAGEAVIPLPSGGKVPVEITGGGFGGSINIERISLELPHVDFRTISDEDVAHLVDGRFMPAIRSAMARGQ